MMNESLLQTLDALSLRFTKPAQGGAGARRSKALGSSVEFSDFRDYTPGDDPRRVDWNAAARFDKLFVKLFMEEKQTCVHILLDASASMLLYEDKWTRAKELTQLMTYLALRGGDTVRLMALSGKGVATSELLNGRQAYMKACAFLESLGTGGEVLLSRELPKIPFKSKGVSILISDFLSADGYERALSALLFEKQEVAALSVLSGEELSPKLSGAVRLTDAETGEEMEFEAGAAALAEYQKTLDKYLLDFHAFCHARGIVSLLLDARADLEKTTLAALSNAGLIG